MKKNTIPRYIRWIALTGFLFLLIMSLLRWALVLSFRTPSGKAIALTDAYLLGMRYDLRMVCIVMLLLFLLGSIPFLHPFKQKRGKRVSMALWIIAIILFVSFYTIDFFNYAYLSQRINADLLNYMQDAAISLGMIWQSYPVIWISLILIIAALLLNGMVRMTYNFILSKSPKSNKRSCIWSGIIFFLLLALGIFGRVGQYPLRWSDAFDLRNDYAANIALNPFQSFASSLGFRHSTCDIQKVRQHYSWMSKYLNVKNPDSTTFNFTRTYTRNTSLKIQPNIVIVICESFSAYKSSMYGNQLNPTPYFNEMCKQGIFFDRCFTPTYGTARGVWATITGIPDVQLAQTASRNPAAVNQHTIINDFKGYEKFYFIGGSTSWANIRGLLTNNIEDLHLYEQDSYKSSRVDVWGISDKNLFLEANKVLTQQAKPFIAVIQTADNHRPYTIPEEDLKDFKKLQAPLDVLKKSGFATLDEYNAFRYTDFCYQKFMETAKQQPYFKNTIFVFVGDHGIPGDAGDMLPKTFTDMSLTAEHVPLLFYSPEILKAQHSSELASQVDILPTVAAMSNISYTNTTMGRNLMEKRDSAFQPCSFIIDANKKQIGTVCGKYYLTNGINDKQNERVGNIHNNEVPTMTEAERKHYNDMSEAFYETSKYMLLNNKKR